MPKMKHWKQLGLIFVLLSLLVACGQKGDLYLPESKVLTSWIEL
jgi:predicted small lipoprotein YifL